MFKELIGGLFAPLANAYKANQDRKAARDVVKGKIQMAKNEGNLKVELTDQEWESLGVDQENKSWKDEYVTVSVVSLFNLLIVGGIAAAFGHAQVLEGMVLAIQALTAAGVDVGFLLNAVVLAAIGLKVWRA